MTYALLRFGHLVGLTLMGAGLIGLFVSDLRSRNAGPVRTRRIIELSTPR